MESSTPTQQGQPRSPSASAPAVVAPAVAAPAGRAHYAWFALLLVAALALRLIGLGSQSLWVDEAFSVNYAKPYAPLTFSDLLDNMHGPLHALVLHAWIRVAGTSEAMLRLPSVAASLLAILAFWLFARRRWGARVAWLGSALLAVSPFHIWYAQEVRNYSFLILFAILAEWAFDNLLRDGPSLQRLAVYGFALLGGFWSNFSMAFLVAQQAVRLLALSPGRSRALVARVALVWLIVIVCLSPWAARFYRYQVKPSALLTTSAVETEEKLRTETTDTPLGLPYTLFTFAAGHSLGPSRRELWTLGPWNAVKTHWPAIAAAAALFGALWMAGIARAWRADRRGALALLLWQALPLLLLLFIASRNVKVINPRYAAVAFPAFVATIAFGIPRGKRGLIAATLVLALSLLSVMRGLFIESYHKEDYRGAAAWLRSELRTGDAFLSIAIDQPIRIVYMREELEGSSPKGWVDFGRVVMRQGAAALRGHGPDSYANMLDSWEPGQRLFVLFAREWIPDPQGALEADLRNRARVIEERRWAGVRVLVLEKSVDAVGQPLGDFFAGRMQEGRIACAAQEGRIAGAAPGGGIACAAQVSPLRAGIVP